MRTNPTAPASTVIVTGGNTAADRIRRSSGNGNVTVLHLDLVSLASVRAFSAAVARAGVPPVRGLVCNAGVQIVSGTRQTIDGFEETFAVNHLGHFLLVSLLLPQLAAPARIVVVSSATHDPDRWTGLPPARFQSPERLADPVGSSREPESASLRGRRRYTTTPPPSAVANSAGHARSAFGHGHPTAKWFD